MLNDGRILAIEVKKDDKSRLSSNQKEFLKKITDNGGLAFKAHSLGCVEKFLKDYL